MVDKKNKRRDDLFKRLTQLFRGGPSIKRKVRAFRSPTVSSAAEVFKKSYSQVYSNALNAYGSYDRMSRYADFQEMECTPEIASAVDIYSEEATSVDDRSAVLHIYSNNPKIQAILDELFHDTLNVDHNLTPWTRNLVKYGDFFLFIDVHPELGVLNVFPMPVNEVERDEGWDPDNPLAIRFRWTNHGNQILESWQVAHFRLMGNDAFLPYGSSILESSRKIWRQLILIEDAMLVYRVVRSPERRVFYIDVGAVPTEQIPNYMEAAQSKLKRSPVIDKASGRIDLRYNPLPVWKGSMIPLLDGRTITIEELAHEHDEGKENWVYSVQDQTHRIVPGKVAWCGKNYTADRLIKVWLDDDTWVMTAPEHPFLLRDGQKKRADELIPGDSLMPLYRKLSDRGTMIGYPMVMDPSQDKFVYVHRVVADEVLSEQKSFVDEKLLRPLNNSLVVHHKDFNKLNASPSNLKWMGVTDHILYHASLGSENIVRYNKSDAKRLRTSYLNRVFKTGERMAQIYNGTELHKQHNTNRRVGQLESWKHNKEERSKAMKWIISTDYRSRLFELLKCNASASKLEFQSLISHDKDLLQLLKTSNSSLKRDVSKFHINTVLAEYKKQGKCTDWKSFKDAVVTGQIAVNHTVRRTELIDGPDDVYCMTVVGPTGENDRHNFGICSFYKDISRGYSDNGLIIVNSVDEDYFIPVRGGESGTRIDTLAGGQHVSDIADVEYIQKKLFAALKVPRAYLGYDESLSSKATLAQEDIRFSRSISKIQRVLISELQKIAYIHLYAHGFEGDDLTDFSLFLSNPSTVAQMQKLELWRTKFEIAGSVPDGLVDRNFLRREIFQLTDDQIDDIEEGRRDDRKIDIALEETDLGSEGGGAGGGGGLGGLPGGGDAAGIFDDLGGGDESEGSDDAGSPGDDAPASDDDAGGDQEDLFAGDEDDGKSLLTSLEPDEDENDELEDGDEDEIDADASTQNGQSLSRALKSISKSTADKTGRKSPASVTPLSKYLYNRGRRRTHGARTTHMPDFKGITSFDSDPIDTRFFNGSPFKEARLLDLINDQVDEHPKPRLSAEIKMMLSSLDRRINSNGQRKQTGRAMLIEGDIDDEELPDIMLTEGEESES